MARGKVVRHGFRGFGFITVADSLSVFFRNEWLLRPQADIPVNLTGYEVEFDTERDEQGRTQAHNILVIAKPGQEMQLNTKLTTGLFSSGRRYRGKVKFFKRGTGWGFIEHDECGDAFVHHTSITSEEGFKYLLPGDVVEFSVLPGEKRPMATDVVLIKRITTPAEPAEPRSFTRPKEKDAKGGIVEPSVEPPVASSVLITAPPESTARDPERTRQIIAELDPELREDVLGINRRDHPARKQKRVKKGRT